MSLFNLFKSAPKNPPKQPTPSQQQQQQQQLPSQKQQQPMNSNPWAPEPTITQTPKQQSAADTQQAPVPAQKSGGSKLFDRPGMKKKQVPKPQDAQVDTAVDVSSSIISSTIVPPTSSYNPLVFDQTNSEELSSNTNGSAVSSSNNINDITDAQSSQPPKKSGGFAARFKKSAPTTVEEGQISSSNTANTINAEMPSQPNQGSEENMTTMQRMRMKKMQKQQQEAQQEQQQEEEDEKYNAGEIKQERAVNHYSSQNEREKESDADEAIPQQVKPYPGYHNNDQPEQIWGQLDEDESQLQQSQPQPSAEPVASTKKSFGFLKKNNKPKQTVEPIIKEEKQPQKNGISILEQIVAEKRRLKVDLTGIVMKQNQLVAQQKDLKDKIIQLKQQRSDLVQEQNDFAERDCFEEAQNLEEEIEALTNSISDAEREIIHSEDAYNQLESDKEMLYASEIKMAEGWLHALSESKKEKIKEKEEFGTTQSQKLKNEKYEIEEATEQLRITQDHISLDRRHLEEETESITTSLNSQTNEWNAEQKKLSTEKEGLTEEIISLREELERKEAQLKTVSESLDGVNTRIKAIQLKFENQLKRIEAKQLKLTEDEGVFETDTESLKSMVESNSRTKQMTENQLAAFDAELLELQNQRNLLSENVLLFKQAKEEREAVSVRFQDAYSVFVEYKRTLVDDEERLEQLANESVEREKKLSDLKAKVAVIADKLPLLESEKKSLVAKKLFKNAGTVATEIKELTTSMEEANAEILALRDEEATHEATVLEIQERKLVSDQELEKLQRVVDAEKVKLLAVKLKDLKSLQEEGDKNEMTSVLDEEIAHTQREIEEIARNLPAEQQVEEVEEQREQGEKQEDNQSSQESIGLTQQDQEVAGIDAGSVVPADGTSIGSSQLQTQADLDQSLKRLIEKVKELKESFRECENTILHLVESENFEQADEMQQKADQLQEKIDALMEQLSQNYSCMNLDEAEEYLIKLESESVAEMQQIEMKQCEEDEGVEKKEQEEVAVDEGEVVEQEENEDVKE